MKKDCSVVAHHKFYCTQWWWLYVIGFFTFEIKEKEGFFYIFSQEEKQLREKTEREAGWVVEYPEGKERIGKK